MCELCGHEHTEKNARKLWRKHGFGRLYKQYPNRNWYYGREYHYHAREGVAGLLMRDAEAVIHEALKIDDSVITSVDEYAYQDEWRNEGREIGDNV
jgi:hypothetical protein